MIEIRRELHKHDARTRKGFNDYRLLGDVGPRPKTCQFIEGDPLKGAPKCGAEAKAGSSFCPAHHARCWKPLDVQK